MNTMFANATVIVLANGNKGAINFLMELVHGNHELGSIANVLKFAITRQVIGTNLYVLWNDLCDRNMDIVFATVHDVSWDVLADACSRQDYSGRQLIAKYILEHELLPDHDGITYANNQKPCKEDIAKSADDGSDLKYGAILNKPNTPDN